MAFPFVSSQLVFSLLLLLVSFPPPPAALSQFPPFNPDSPPATMAACAPRLLPLSPCAGFVQGMARVPMQACCDNLGQLNSEQPDCLCLLFTNSSSFPVNSSLAMRLPALCNVRVNATICSGLPGMDGSPDAPSSRHRNSPRRRRPHDNSPTVAASPMVVEVAPQPSSSGFGSSSSGVKLKEEDSLALLMTLAAITFTKLMCLIFY